MRTAKIQASLGKCAVLPEPSLFAVLTGKLQVENWKQWTTEHAHLCNQNWNLHKAPCDAAYLNIIFHLVMILFITRIFFQHLAWVQLFRIMHTRCIFVKKMNWTVTLRAILLRDLKFLNTIFFFQVKQKNIAGCANNFASVYVNIMTYFSLKSVPQPGTNTGFLVIHNIASRTNTLNTTHSAKLETKQNKTINK